VSATEAASGDQADLGVDLLDGGVGELDSESRFDHLTLLGDPTGHLDERLEPAPRCHRGDDPVGVAAGHQLDLLTALRA
jgi:hypothetical protein